MKTTKQKTKQKTITMPCLFCGESIEVEKGGLEEQGILNVFCRVPKLIPGTKINAYCEERYAFRQ